MNGSVPGLHMLSVAVADMAASLALHCRWVAVVEGGDGDYHELRAPDRFGLELDTVASTPVVGCGLAR